jgi:hypothetical protein
MDKITSFLLENWVYVLGAVVLFGQNILAFIKEKIVPTLSSLRLRSKPVGFDGEFVQKIIDGINGTDGSDYKTDVVRDIDCFNWIKSRALDAGDQSLLQELEDVNKKFYTSVYSTLYKPTASAKQLPK